MRAAKCYTEKKTHLSAIPKSSLGVLWRIRMQVCWDGLAHFQSFKALSPKPSSHYPGLSKAVVHGSRTSERGGSCRGVKPGKIPKWSAEINEWCFNQSSHLLISVLLCFLSSFPARTRQLQKGGGLSALGRLLGINQRGKGVSKHLGTNLPFFSVISSRCQWVFNWEFERCCEMKV